MRYQVPSNTGMTTSKRIRAIAPAILIFIAFLGFVAAVNGMRPIRLIKPKESRFPMVAIFWGLDRITSTGVTLPFYDQTGKDVPPQQPSTPPLLAKPGQPAQPEPNLDEMIERLKRLKQQPPSDQP